MQFLGAAGPPRRLDAYSTVTRVPAALQAMEPDWVLFASNGSQLQNEAPAAMPAAQAVGWLPHAA